MRRPHTRAGSSEGCGEALSDTALEFHSRAEVDEAVAALPPAEWMRFRLIGGILSGKLVGVSAEDIVNETILRMLGGAENVEARGRHWPADVGFVPFFVETMKSVASQWYDQRYPRRLRKEGGPGLVLVDKHGPKQGSDETEDPPVGAEWMKPAPDPESAIIQRQECEEILNGALKAVANNDNACLMVEAFADDMSRAEIKDLLSFDDRAYNSLRRLVRRRFNKRIPDGFSS